MRRNQRRPGPLSRGERPNRTHGTLVAKELGLAPDDSPNRRGTHRVYFMHLPLANWIKVGYSHDPYQRLASLRNASGFPIELIGTIDGGKAMERVLHERFAKHRLMGEWFSRAILPDVYELIAEDQQWFGDADAA